MSRQSQEQWLASFEKKLNQNLPRYRRHQANKITHVFTMQIDQMAIGVKDGLEKQLGTSDNIDLVIKGVKPLLAQLIGNTRDKVSKNENQYVNVREVAYIPGMKYQAIFSASVNEKGQLKKVYTQIYNTYNKELDKIADKIASLSSELLGKAVKAKAKHYWNLSHEEDMGVKETLVRDALDESLADIPDMPIGEVMAYLDTTPIDIRIIRDTKGMYQDVFVGSKVQNDIDARASRNRAAVLKEVVAEMKKELRTNGGKKIAGLPGSDSFTDIKRKEIIKNTTEKFKRVNGVKVKHEDTKIKHSKTVVKSASKNIRGTGMARPAATKTATGGKRKKAGTQFDPLQLIVALNKQLPQTVRKNMQPPGLANRTGRFASSVKVTEIQQTPKGFPSIGYTYRKTPYQVFEEGSGEAPWANGERDPRDLIEGSIREIAQKMAIGRFYTRRV